MTNAPITAQAQATVLRGPQPWVPGVTFVLRPGLAEQIAQLIEAYDGLVEDGAAATAERLSSKGALITQGQVDLATRQIEHQDRIEARRAESDKTYGPRALYGPLSRRTVYNETEGPPLYETAYQYGEVLNDVTWDDAEAPCTTCGGYFCVNKTTDTKGS